MRAPADQRAEIDDDRIVQKGHVQPLDDWPDQQDEDGDGQQFPPVFRQHGVRAEAAQERCEATLRELQDRITDKLNCAPQEVSGIAGIDEGAALAELDAAMDGINAQRAIYGAGMNRLEYAIDNLTNGSQNAAASRSRIEDADYAKETTELARTQIIQQASTAMLAQANQSNQSVLSLLKG